MRVGRAARADQFDANFVARAKDFERAAKQDLEQYRAWLDHYAAADQKDRQKHERRLKREQARNRRQVRYRYARRLAYRYGSATLHFILATAASCWKAIVLFSVLVLLLVAATTKWIAVKAQIFALLLVRSARSAIAWTKPRVYRLAVRSRWRTAHGLDWVALQTARMDAWAAVRRRQAATYAGAKGSQAATWTAMQGSRAVAFAGAKGSQAATFTSTQARAGARAASHEVANGYAWSAARAQDCARALPPMMQATRRGASRARDYTVAHALAFRDRTTLGLAALGESARRLVAFGLRAEAGREPAIALLTFQPAQGALVPVAPASTALTVFEPAPWTGADERGLNITAPEPLTDPAPEVPSPKRKRRAVKARPHKPRRGPHRKHQQNSAASGKPRPRGKKGPRAG